MSPQPEPEGVCAALDRGNTGAGISHPRRDNVKCFNCTSACCGGRLGAGTLLFQGQFGKSHSCTGTGGAVFLLCQRDQLLPSSAGEKIILAYCCMSELDALITAVTSICGDTLTLPSSQSEEFPTWFTLAPLNAVSSSLACQATAHLAAEVTQLSDQMHFASV